MNIFQMINGVKSGTLDARTEVINMLNRMTPAQRKQAMSILPQVESIAKQAGISTEGFKEELSAQLT